MEYSELRWICDSCKRDARKGVHGPPGWREIAVDDLGRKMHACPDPACVAKMLALASGDGVEEKDDLPF